MALGGIWARGRWSRRNIDRDPFTSETLLEIVQAKRDDVDVAYSEGARSQRDWAGQLPDQRAQVAFTR